MGCFKSKAEQAAYNDHAGLGVRGWLILRGRTKYGNGNYSLESELTKINQVLNYRPVPTL